MKITMEKASVGAAVVCVGACAASLGLGGAFVGMTAGGIAAVLSGEVAVVAGLTVVLTGAWYWYRRSQVAKAAACTCASDAGCKTAQACDLPQAGFKLPQN